MAENKTILVAEDNESVLSITQRLLEKLGYDVLIAANGKEALRIYRDHQRQIGLVLTDAVMPEMDGLALFEAMREIDPAVKVILMSAYDIQGVMTNPRTEKAEGFLQKPAGILDLKNILQRAFKE